MLNAARLLAGYLLLLPNVLCAQRVGLGFADRCGDRLYLVVVKAERGGRKVVFEVRACCGSGDGQCDGRDCEQPRERGLVGACAESGRRRREHLPVCGVVPSAKGAVGDESEPVRLALVEHVPPAAVAEVESVLHGADLGDGLGNGELLECDTGDADVADLALVLKLLERADRLRERDGWVGGMQLVEIDRCDRVEAGAEMPRRRSEGGRGGRWASSR